MEQHDPFDDETGNPENTGSCDFSHQQGLSHSGSRRSSDRSTTEDDDPTFPAWRKWSLSVKNLLADEDGNRLFTDFLIEENMEDVLFFYLAVNGMKVSNQVKTAQIAKYIYDKWIRVEGQLPLSQTTRERLDWTFQVLKAELTEGSSRQADSRAGVSRQAEFGSDVFNAAQGEALTFLEETLHPQFIASEKYVNFINDYQNKNLVPFEEEEYERADSVREYADEGEYHSSQVAPPGGSHFQANSWTQPNDRLTFPAALSAVTENSIEERNSDFSESDQNKNQQPSTTGYKRIQVPVMTKENLAVSRSARQAGCGKKPCRNDESPKTTNRLIGKSYNAFLPPTLQASEVDSQVSGASQERRQRSPLTSLGRRNNPDELNFSAAKKMASRNIENKSIQLPVTELERRRDKYQPREPDSQKFQLELSDKMAKVSHEEQMSAPRLREQSSMESRDTDVALEQKPQNTCWKCSSDTSQQSHHYTATAAAADEATKILLAEQRTSLESSLRRPSAQTGYSCNSQSSLASGSRSLSGQNPQTSGRKTFGPVSSSSHDPVRDSVRDQVRGQVRDPVRGRVGGNVRRPPSQDTPTVLYRYGNTSAEFFMSKLTGTADLQNFKKSILSEEQKKKQGLKL